MIQSGSLIFGAAVPMSSNLPVGGVHEWGLDLPASDPARSNTYQSPDIAFSQPFANVPQLVVCLNGFDVTQPTQWGVTPSPQPQLEIRLSAVDVQREEFNVRVDVAPDTLLNVVWVTWIAHDSA